MSLASASASAEDTQPQEATLRFLADWQEVQEGEIRPGGRLIIYYDSSRLPQCSISWRGARVRELEVNLRFHPGGQSLKASTLRPISAGPNGFTIGYEDQPVEIRVPPDAERVELWFHNFYQVSSRCDAWDSRFGQNYWYEVKRDA